MTRESPPFRSRPLYVPLASLQNPSADTKVWRYLDLTKLVAMLEARALYFCCVAKLADPFEGSFPESHWEEFGRSLEGRELAHPVDQILRMHRGFGRVLRETFYANCWHVNPGESAAMWALYLKSNEGIAIQSTFARLRDSIAGAPQRIHFGLVEYVDYHRDALPPGNIFAPMFCKRRSYAHEKELRAVYWDWDQLKKANETARPYQAAVHGFNIPADLGALVEVVHVAPTAPPFVQGVIKAVLAKYGLRKPVRQSDLSESPVW